MIYLLDQFNKYIVHKLVIKKIILSKMNVLKIEMKIYNK